jgi:hypothetical protein
MMIVISSGHGLHVRGAAGPEPWGLDEVDEARKVVAEVADWLTLHGHKVEQVHDDVSHNQSDNLHYIVAQHNKFPADDRLDVSVHFNAYTADPDAGRGTECLYLTQETLAEEMATAIAAAGGLINRGAKYRSDLYFLNGTTGTRGAILLEVCFVDAGQDCESYLDHFEGICIAIADTIAPSSGHRAPFRAIGKVSWFGGPNDDGVDEDEDLAWWDDLDTALDDAPELFLNYQPSGTTGLARRLDPAAHYIAMRWDYDVWSKSDLASGEIMFQVKSPKTKKHVICRPADWGPHTSTNRVADVSPAVLDKLGIDTDDEVEVTVTRRAA